MHSKGSLYVGVSGKVCKVKHLIFTDQHDNRFASDMQLLTTILNVMCSVCERKFNEVCHTINQSKITTKM